MAEELKPCPFCGGAVRFHSDEDCHGCHYIECSGCKAMFDFSPTTDPEWAEADCLLTITPLYTHPADQVADDLTMVKVSRELLQDLRDLASDSVEHHRQAFAGYKQTRQASMDSVIRDADALLAKS